MNLKHILTAGLLLLSGFVLAQDKAPANWFNLDPAQGVPGLGTESLYKRIPADKKGQTVVVAVIDGGVDYEHEDLKAVMWKNPKEIPGNKKDDDGNGYIDDVYGWNFIGNAKGENIHHDNLEVTRLYAQYKKQFDGKDPDKLSGKDKKAYAEYEQMKEEVESKREEAQQNFALYSIVKQVVADLKKAIGKENPTKEDLKNFKSTDMRLSQVAQMLLAEMNNGATFQDFENDLQEAYDYFDSRANYNFNPDYEPRKLVGDNYSNLAERYYGNGDVRGPDASHGTHVAGIIAAARGNGIGMDGVANNVRIMAVRTVPDGDERDKDVANAILYAVDNGAQVINMSFGKGYSPNKEVVDKAIKYAMKKDVLLVHAAGNDGQENDFTNTFPNDQFKKKGLFGPKYAANWIEIGASDWRGGESLAAEFSNYSPKLVDVFAPGVDIYSTVPGSKYQDNQGTSMAAPMVAGVAAVLRSYFPDLTAVQVKEIIMASAVPQSGQVAQPGTGEMVPFSELCVTGGIVNIEKAMELASKTPGKKKINGTSGNQRLTTTDIKAKERVTP